MSTPLRAVALSAAVVLVAVSGCQLLGPGGNVGGPSASPGVTPSPSAEAGPHKITSGALQAGLYTTTAFEPTLTFELDDGWVGLFPDDADEIGFERDGNTGGFYIGRVSQVVNPAGCPWPCESEVSAPDDIIAWLAEHPAFEPVGDPSDVTVAGLAGRALVLDVISPTEAEIFAYPTGNTRVRLGFRLRYTVLPMDGPDLVITCFGTTQAVYDQTLPLCDASTASLIVH